jgi:hypothetical protein
MKKLILILIAFLVGIIGDGQQSFNDPIKDIGYYYGVVDDSLCNKYIFMAFLSNDGDNIIYIVPYILNETDSDFMHENFVETLNNEEDVDGNILTEKGWTISGFDNYSYYTFEKNIISFSLNIASLSSNHLGIFEFKGKLLENGTIFTSISSTDTIFNETILILTYKELPQ